MKTNSKVLFKSNSSTGKLLLLSVFLNGRASATEGHIRKDFRSVFARSLPMNGILLSNMYFPDVVRIR